MAHGVTENYFIYILIFQLFGFLPCKLPANILPRCVLKWISYISFTYLLYHIVNVYLQHERILYSKSLLGKFNDVIKSSSIYLCYVVTLLESYFMRNDHFLFWKNIIAFDKLVKTENIKKSYKIHMKIVFLICINLITCSISFISNFGINEQPYLYFKYNYPALYICRVKHLQYFLYVNLINERLTFVKHELIILDKLFHNKRIKFNNEYKFKAIKRLKFIKECYDELLIAISLLNECNGWSEVTNFLQLFLNLYSDIYFSFIAYFTIQGHSVHCK